MTMKWALKQKGWRAVFIRIALLTTLWLAVAFVFATEIYLSAPGGPLKISWMMAAESAFRDWFPWILLSPLAITLAEKFRFDRLAVLAHRRQKLGDADAIDPLDTKELD